MPLRQLHGGARERAAEDGLFGRAVQSLSDVQANPENVERGSGGPLRDQNRLERWPQYRDLLFRSSAQDLRMRGVQAEMKLARGFIWLLLAVATQAATKPKLVVAIIVDQFRYDYMTRFDGDYQ